ncbi:MAG TPA: lipase family protein [Ramlibacter sp.]
MRKFHVLTAVAVAVLVVACGGGGGNDRGALLEPPQTVTTLTAAQIDAGTQSSGLRALSGPAQCDVKVTQLHYATVGVNGEEANASGAMLVPAGACAAASHPLVAYAKGTDVQKPRTLANPADGETFLLAAMYAAQGYAVVATDYLGYAKSTYSFHPYLHAETEAASVIDSIRAARNAAPSQGAALSGKVMLTGYSQGGHASMAAQRAIERDLGSEIDIAAAAHLAGPYNLSGSMRLTSAIAGYQFFVPFLVTAWQKVYGNLYGSVTQAFKAPYSNYIETLLPNPTMTYTTLVTSGTLPGGPGVSPDQARDLVFQPAFVADMQTNPDNAVVQAARKNDLLGWNPRSRTLLCGGAGDPTVPGALHMGVAQADFASRGLANVTSVDVDPMVRAAFGVNGQPPTDPASAAFATYYENYHGTYEPPLCHAQARALFNSVR